MSVEVNPKETSRASAYELWLQAPNPMVTFFKTMDVTELIRTSRKRKLKFNMLLDYCIGKAAAAFAKTHGAELTVMEEGEHWFHTDEQMHFLDNWIISERSIR